MIREFEEKMSDLFGVDATSFDPEYAQWTYLFKKGLFSLEFVYALDKTISTALYYNENLLSFYFANGLEHLSIEDNKIHGVIVKGNTTRKLEIDPLNLIIKWEDSLI
ncbi:hypothetical protein KV337_005218 [Escherichia coli]|uniref:Uncharacterized protein n=1 Tax=Escherichia coli TaxID=562 RepID=A0AAI9BAR1_ECOLX|nr:hypothetical protein [Escherichia coli]HDQ6534398.1 hypothetical protein [Escherichia coli O36:H14]ANO89051.1 hypothetical protein GJ11_10000 [Escherichia coli]EFI6954753.1 hypothetical protein [Escherichia coli]EHR9389314.1 hypothetical protein [Escherichia coli]EHS3289007.1 hypothetical protein [Escherichia coli]